MLTQLAVLTAIMIIFHLTGVGYFRIGIFSLTIMAVPLIIGAITLGKAAGAILGGVFGFTVILLPETQFFMNLNLAGALIVCIATRILLGFLSGAMFQSFAKFDDSKIWSYAVTGLFTSLLNTFFVMGGIALIFGSDPAVQEAFGAAGLGKMNFFIVIIGAVALQAVIEAAICAVVAGSAAKAIHIFLKKGA